MGKDDAQIFSLSFLDLKARHPFSFDTCIHVYIYILFKYSMRILMILNTVLDRNGQFIIQTLKVF